MAAVARIVQLHRQPNFERRRIGQDEIEMHPAARRTVLVRRCDAAGGVQECRPGLGRGAAAPGAGLGEVRCAGFAEKDRGGALTKPILAGFFGLGRLVRFVPLLAFGIVSILAGSGPEQLVRHFLDVSG